MTTLDTGDWRTSVLTVPDGDGTTVAVLTVVKPDSTTATPVVTPSVDHKTYTAAAYELTLAGEWLERWVVTGTGKTTDRTQLLVAPDPTTTPTGARVYATTTDYANALHTAPPTNSRRALEAASRVIDEMLLTAVYDVDTAGMPTKASVILAMRDATCMQAEFAKARGDANNVSGGAASAGVSGFSIGSVTVQRGQPAGVATSIQLAPHWSPVAYRRLAEEKLTGQEPWSY